MKCNLNLANKEILENRIPEADCEPIYSPTDIRRGSFCPDIVTTSEGSDRMC